MNESNVHYIIHSQSIVRKYQAGIHNDILNLYKNNKQFIIGLNDFDYDIKKLEILLLRGLITSVNNEFKPERLASRREKLNLIKRILGINEYKVALNKNLNKFEFRKIDYLYLKLIQIKAINLLYVIAKLRCKRIHRNSKIYD